MLDSECEVRDWGCSMPKVSVSEIEEILIKDVADILSMDRGTVTVDVPFQSLGMSSMDFVELLVVIETTFDLNLIETDLKKEDFLAINTLASCISRMM
jgi:acyl carrier protein